MPERGNSPHILTTASNLLGFSFIALSSLKGLGLAQASYLDEIVGLCVITSAVSCLFSFLSMRTSTAAKGERYELIADYIFFFTLLAITTTAALLTVDIIRFSN